MKMFALCMYTFVLLGALGQSRDKDPVDFRDPGSDSFYNWWCSVAKRNSEIFDKVGGNVTHHLFRLCCSSYLTYTFFVFLLQVFKCAPTDLAHSFEELSEYLSTPPLAETDAAAANELLEQIQGMEWLDLNEFAYVELTCSLQDI